MIKVLAVADADSYLKWAAATVDRLDDRFTTKVVVLHNPIEPSPTQVAAAVAHTRLEGQPVETVPLLKLKALLTEVRPDVLLIAATGPVVELVARAATALDRRPAIVTGLPGMALPATRLGAEYRTLTDAFIVHSRRERTEYAAAFAGIGRHPRLLLGRLPFAPPPRTSAEDIDTDVHRIVFAVQAKVPDPRPDRVRILDALVRAGEHREVIVKVRALGQERQTHNEAYPYEVIWEQDRAKHDWPDGRITVAGGPLAGYLTPGTGLVTVSSTAALEALAAGVPVAMIDDFGLSDELLNPPFEGSGLLRSLEDVVAGRFGAPDPTWWTDNYGHPDPDEIADGFADLGTAAQQGTLPARSRRDRAPRSRLRHARFWLRCALPDPVVEGLRSVKQRIRGGR